LPARIGIARMASGGLRAVDPEGMRFRPGVSDVDAAEVVLAGKRVLQRGIHVELIEGFAGVERLGRGAERGLHALGHWAQGSVLVSPGSVLVPVEDRGVIDPAAAPGEGLGPLGAARERPLLRPVDVPAERLVEADGHVVVEAVDGKPRGAGPLDQGHSRPQAGKRGLKTPTEPERILRAEVIQPPKVPVDVHLVVAFHHVVEAAKHRLVGHHAVLPAEEVPAALDLEQHFVRLFRQLETLAVVGGVEVAELIVPLGQGLPFHEAVIRQVLAGIIAQEHPGPGPERHGEIAVVAPRGALDELRGEVRALAVAAVPEEIGERADHGRLPGVVEPDLQHHAAGGKLLGVVPGGMDAADDPRAFQIGHGHPLLCVEFLQVRVPVVGPARVGEPRAHGRPDGGQPKGLVVGFGPVRGARSQAKRRRNQHDSRHRHDTPPSFLMVRQPVAPVFGDVPWATERTRPRQSATLFLYGP